MSVKFLILIFCATLPSASPSCSRKYAQNYIGYRRNAGEYTIICTNIVSTDTIASSNNNNDGLKITNSSLTTIPALFFSKFSAISKLSLNQLNIETIEAGAFTGLTYLRELDISNNELSEVTTGIFNSLQHLQILKLGNNRIITIDKSAFMGVVSLTHLYLNNNNLSSIEGDLLKTQTRLQHLDLSHNALSELEFTHFPNVTDLDLSKNRIVSINVTFVGVLQLDLSHNQLQTLEKTIFENSKNVAIVDFSYNSISTIDDEVFRELTSLYQLFLQNNRITKLETSLFRDLSNLTILNLSSNRIDEFEFGTFDNLKKLTILDISSNRLLSLPQYTFHSLSRLSNVSFDDNQISTFDAEDLTSHLPSLRFVSLNNNPWSCAELVKINHVFKTKRVAVAEGDTYNVPNVHGIPCSNLKISQNQTDVSKFNVNDFAKIFQKMIDGGVANSKMERFFGEDFKKSKFFQYFDQDYARSNFFKYLDNYQLAALDKSVLNDSKVDKLSSLQVTPHENSNNILIVSVVLQVGILASLLFIIYLKYNLFRLSKYNFKPQLSSQMEL